MKKIDKSNKKILESKKIKKKEKKKIKIEKKMIRKKRREAFNKTRFGRIFGKVFFIFSDKDSYSFSEVFGITLFSLILGAFACFSLFSIFSGGRNYFKLSSELGKFYDVYEVLVDNYYGEIDKDELIDEAIEGMVSSVGDVYTSYNSQSITDNFNQLVSGTYEGIGCTIQQREKEVVILEVYDNTPASKAGMKSGDIVKSIDGMNALEVGIEKLSTYIKEEAKGKVKIKILREEEELEFVLERGKVEIPAITAKSFDKNDKKVGYIGISIFSSVSSKQFEKELKLLEDDGIDALVIDVRGNNGGYLSAVTDIVSYLLPRGKVIYQVQKDDNKDVTKDKSLTKREYPIAVLTDGNSASASEILAAAIKESYDGYVVGTKTYGKGTVQQVKKLSDGSMVKYTVENWLTPDGNWIDGEGIEPTNEVILSEEYVENPSDETDNQLQKALDLVSK